MFEAYFTQGTADGLHLGDFSTIIYARSEIETHVKEMFDVELYWADKTLAVGRDKTGQALFAQINEVT